MISNCENSHLQDKVWSCLRAQKAAKWIYLNAASSIDYYINIFIQMQFWRLYSLSLIWWLQREPENFKVSQPTSFISANYVTVMSQPPWAHTVCHSCFGLFLKLMVLMAHQGNSMKSWCQSAQLLTQLRNIRMESDHMLHF